MATAFDSAVPSAAESLGAWRSRFPILRETTYLISNSLGAMPDLAASSLSRYAEQWASRGVRAWEESWWDLPVRVGNLVAPLLGVGTGEVAMQPNVTIATAIFLSCLDYPASRNRVVYTDHNFPTLRYLLDGELAKGAEITVVPSDDGIGVDLERLLGEIDERTRLVPISHALYKTGFTQDAKAIAQRCREVGALLLLDVYQSAGIMPLGLREWGVDAAVGGCLKWLCGGPGNAFLWVRPGLDRQLEPKLTGWQSHVEPFAFEREHRRVDAGSWRFLTGTPGIPSLSAAVPGLEILAQLDLEAVREHSLALTACLLECAHKAGFETRTPKRPEQRGGTVTVFHPEAQTLGKRLLERQIVCDVRPGAGIRLAPHFYNTGEECERAIEALSELVG